MIQLLAALSMTFFGQAHAQEPYYVCKSQKNSCTYTCPYILSRFCQAVHGSCENQSVEVGTFHASPDLPKDGRVAVLPGPPYVLFCKHVGTLKASPAETPAQTYRRLFR